MNNERDKLIVTDLSYDVFLRYGDRERDRDRQRDRYHADRQKRDDINTRRQVVNYLSDIIVRYLQKTFATHFLERLSKILAH